MKKILIMLLVLMFTATSLADLDPSAGNPRSTFHNAYAWGGHNVKDKATLWAQEVEDSLDGTEGVDNLLFDERTSDPTASSGRIYFNTTSNVFKYYNGSSWISLSGLEAGAAGTLDDSYNSGYAIDVDGTAVTLTVSDGDNNAGLIVTNNDATNNANCIEAVVAASNTGAGLYVDGTTGTIDLLGDNFSLANTGILTMTNGDAIDNSTTDDIFQFTSNDKEDFSIDLSGTNIIGFSSDTSAITLEFNALDRLIGIEDITFDAEAANITLTGNANTEDLTISQAGTVDCSLILSSAGSITDALSLITTDAVGVLKISSSDILDVDAVDHMNFDISGAASDFRVDSAAGSVYIEGAEADADAIKLSASNAAGGINVDAGSGNIDIDVTGGDITIDNDGAGKNLDIDITAGSIYLDGGEADAKAIWLAATAGGIDIDTAATYDVDVDAVGGKILLTATENAANTIHIEENGGASGGINLYANQGTGVAAATEHDASIQLQSDAGGIGLYTTSNQGEDIRIEANGGTDEFITIHSNQGTGADSITLLSDAGGIAITTSAGAIVASAIGGSAGDVTISAGDIMTLTSVDTKIFDGAAAETWIVEGTADDHEASVVFTDPTADYTWTFPDSAADILAVMGTTHATNAPEAANSVTGGTASLIFEGANVDAHECTLTAVEPTADSTLTLADDTGGIAYLPTGATTKDVSDAALPLTHAVVQGTSDGTSSWSLPDGNPGQVLSVVIVTDGGDATITPDSLTGCGWASLILADDGDGVTFIFVDATVGWIILGTWCDGTDPVAVTPSS